MTAEERYTRDPEFHALVHQLLNQIEAGRFTPTELREAVILAATKYEMYHIRQMRLGSVEDAP
jgi:hypothetical protein